MKNLSAWRLFLSIVSDPALLSGLYHTLLHHAKAVYGTGVSVSFRTSYGLEGSSALVMRRNLQPYNDCDTRSYFCQHTYVCKGIHMTHRSAAARTLYRRCGCSCWACRRGLTSAQAAAAPGLWHSSLLHICTGWMSPQLTHHLLVPSHCPLHIGLHVFYGVAWQQLDNLFPASRKALSWPVQPAVHLPCMISNAVHSSA